jgi:hypothetical protein
MDPWANLACRIDETHCRKNCDIFKIRWIFSTSFDLTIFCAECNSIRLKTLPKHHFIPFNIFLSMKTFFVIFRPVNILTFSFSENLTWPFTPFCRGSLVNSKNFLRVAFRKIMKRAITMRTF